MFQFPLALGIQTLNIWGNNAKDFLMQWLHLITKSIIINSEYKKQSSNIFL